MTRKRIARAFALLRNKKSRVLGKKQQQHSRFNVGTIRTLCGVRAGTQGQETPFGDSSPALCHQLHADRPHRAVCVDVVLLHRYCLQRHPRVRRGNEVECRRGKAWNCQSSG